MTIYVDRIYYRLYFSASMVVSKYHFLQLEDFYWSYYLAFIGYFPQKNVSTL